MNRKITKLRLLALAMLLLGVIILGYFWKVLGDRGLYADRAGTAGYTANTEIIFILVGLALCVSSLVMLVKLSVKKKRRDI